MNNQNDYIEAAQQIIVSLGLPERSRTSVPPCACWPS
jgi:hypothetical protein